MGSVSVDINTLNKQLYDQFVEPNAIERFNRILSAVEQADKKAQRYRLDADKYEKDASQPAALQANDPIDKRRWFNSKKRFIERADTLGNNLLRSPYFSPDGKISRPDTGIRSSLLQYLKTIYVNMGHTNSRNYIQSIPTTVDANVLSVLQNKKEPRAILKRLNGGDSPTPNDLKVLSGVQQKAESVSDLFRQINVHHLNTDPSLNWKQHILSSFNIGRFNTSQALKLASGSLKTTVSEAPTEETDKKWVKVNIKNDSSDNDKSS